jgi:hypothetical protein
LRTEVQTAVIVLSVAVVILAVLVALEASFISSVIGRQNDTIRRMALASSPTTLAEKAVLSRDTPIPRPKGQAADPATALALEAAEGHHPVGL